MRAETTVIGAGVIGCAVARELAMRGRSVIVIDRDRPGGHASWAAAGMLAPQAEARGPGPFVDLLLEARRIYPEIAAALLEETDLDIGYRDDGVLAVALGDDDEEKLAGIRSWQDKAGLPVTSLDADGVQEHEPALSGAITSGLHFPGDHQVENRTLARALWFSAAIAGAEFLIGNGVTRIRPVADGNELILENGQRVTADTVVVAAGCWSGLIEGLPRKLPVRPVHGQLLALETAPPLLTHTIYSSRGYLVPRADGRLIVGATVEERGYDTSVTSDGIAGLLAAAVELVPALADRPVIEQWSGMRPGTPDNLPVIGADPDRNDLVYATGHFRNGILLAPITGRIVAELICEGKSTVDLEPFRPDRF